MIDIEKLKIQWEDTKQANEVIRDGINLEENEEKRDKLLMWEDRSEELDNSHYNILINTSQTLNEIEESDKPADEKLKLSEPLQKVIDNANLNYWRDREALIIEFSELMSL